MIIGLIGGLVAAVLLVIIVLAAWSYSSRRRKQQNDAEKFLDETNKAHTIMVRSTKFTNGKQMSFPATPPASQEMSPVLGSVDTTSPPDNHSRDWVETGRRNSVGAARATSKDENVRSGASSPSRETSSAIDAKCMYVS